MRFAVHVAIGIAMFAAIALGAIALHYFVIWMAGQGVAEWMVNVAMGLEYALFAVDAILFTIYIVRTAVHHGHLMATAEVE